MVVCLHDFSAHIFARIQSDAKPKYFLSPSLKIVYKVYSEFVRHVLLPTPARQRVVCRDSMDSRRLFSELVSPPPSTWSLAREMS